MEKFREQLQMNDIAIRVDHLGKEYRLGERLPYRTLRDDISHLFRSSNPQSAIRNSQSEGILWALKDVSFEVKRGEVIGIIGRNGAGKSTLLKILSRITEPTEGYAEINGRVGSLLEVGTGFHNELTGRENIYFNGAILGMKKKEIDHKFDEIVAFAEMEKFLDTPVKHYSSGMYVRLGFAVAAYLEQEILMVDEVLAVGDAIFQKKCLGKMNDLAKEGRTVVFVTHNMTAISNLCTQGLLLTQGSLNYSGTATDAVRYYLSQNGQSPNVEQLEWKPASRTYPLEHIVKIEKFYVINEDREVATAKLFNHAKYEIVVDAELKQSDERLIFMIAFFATDGTLLFVTDIHDTGKVEFAKLGPGRIRLSVPVPSEWFGNSSYEIELLCVVHSVGWILPLMNESRLRFEFFRDSDQNPYSHENRLGALSPTLKWSIARRA